MIEHLTDFPNLEKNDLCQIDKDIKNILKYCYILNIDKSNIHNVEFYDSLIVKAGAMLDLYRRKEKK